MQTEGKHCTQETAAYNLPCSYFSLVLKNVTGIQKLHERLSPNPLNLFNTDDTMSFNPSPAIIIESKKLFQTIQLFPDFACTQLEKTKHDYWNHWNGMSTLIEYILADTQQGMTCDITHEMEDLLAETLVEYANTKIPPYQSDFPIPPLVQVLSDVTNNAIAIATFTQTYAPDCLQDAIHLIGLSACLAHRTIKGIHFTDLENAIKEELQKERQFSFSAHR